MKICRKMVFIEDQSNPFAYDDSYSEANRKKEEHREKMKSFLEAEEYEAFALCEEEYIKDFDPFDIKDGEAVLNVINETEAFGEIFTRVFPYMTDFFLEMEVDEKIRALSYLIKDDEADLFMCYLEKLDVPTDRYMDLLQISVAYLATDCMERLFALEYDWILSPCIYYGWVTQNLGVPKADSCARQIAMHFLPKEVKDALRPEDPTPYPMHNPKSMFAELAFFGTSKEFFLDYIAFFLSTPVMNHWIKNDLLEKFELNQLPEILEKGFHEAVVTMGGGMRGEENGGKTLGFSWYVEDIGFNTYYDSYAFKQTFPHYENLANVMECVLETYPDMIKKESVRSVVASMALVDRPTEAMLKRAANFTGKRLIIKDLLLPWFDWSPCQDRQLVEGDLFSRWEERMPKKLKPAFKHNDFSISLDVESWLEKCEVVGAPKGDSVTTLALSLIMLPCDSPCFLEALQEGGILHQQREKYWEWINVRKSDHRGHYLASITHLKESKTYEL